jgi:hypothetical protein
MPRTKSTARKSVITREATAVRKAATRNAATRNAAATMKEATSAMNGQLAFLALDMTAGKIGPMTREDFLKLNMIKEFMKGYNDARCTSDRPWACSACTFENACCANACEMCRTAKCTRSRTPAVAMRPEYGTGATGDSRPLLSSLAAVGSVSDDVIRDQLNEYRKQAVKCAEAEWNGALRLSFDSGAAFFTGDSNIYGDLLTILKARIWYYAGHAAPPSWFQ